MDLRPGIQVGAYRLQHELGSGGFGAVWAATKGDDSPVAMKFLHQGADSVDRRRFGLEARALTALDHPNCLKVLEHGLQEGSPYLVLELVRGETLYEWFKRGPLAPSDATTITRQIASALKAAHAIGIVHRDLKPSNIMVARDANGTPHVTVLDFGIAKLLGVEHHDVTKTGEVIGTPGWMSPEQLRGRRDIGPATDLYSLGLLLFQMFEGRPPFEGTSPMAVAMAHLTEPVPRCAAAPPHIQRLIGELLHKEPQRRPTVTHVESLLEDDAPTRAAPQPVRERAVSQPQKHRSGARQIALVVAVATMVVAAVVAITWEPEQPIPLTPPAALVDVTSSTTTQDSPIASPERTPSRCAPQKRGRLELPIDRGLDTGAVLTYLPQMDASLWVNAVIVLLHEGKQSPHGIMDELAMDGIAEKHGVVLIAPSNRDLHHDSWGSWENPEARREAWGDVRGVIKKLCLNDPAILLIGHSSGGYAAERFVREEEGIAAVVVSSERFELPTKGDRGHGTYEPPERPVPHLMLSPLQDQTDPIEGGPTSCGLNDVISLAESEQRARKTHGCGDAVTKRKVRHGRCFKWECDTLLEACHIDGGRHWRDIEGKPYDTCEGPSVDFPYQEVVWDFFVRAAPEHLSLPESLGCPHRPEVTSAVGWNETIRPAVGGSAANVRTYIPPNYGVDGPSPLIVLIPERGITREDAATELRFEEVADAQGAAIVVVRRLPKAQLMGPSMASVEIPSALDQLCVDQRRVFVVADASGGDVLEELLCDANRGYPITAVATTSHRFSDANPACEAAEAVPRIVFTGKTDRRHPIEGGSAEECGTRTAVWSRDDHDAALLKRHQCDGPSHQSSPGCETWSCETPFTSCLVDGGRHWRTREDHRDPDCLGKPADLDYAAAIWSFFEEHSP